MTRRFYEKSQDWVNKSVESSEMKARYAIALLAEMQSARETLSVEGFANTNLDLEDRDRYVRYMQGNDVPVQAFNKATTLISSHLGKLQFAFLSGVTVICPADQLDRSVSIASVDGIKSQMTITGEMKEVKGRATPGRSPEKPVDQDDE